MLPWLKGLEFRQEYKGLGDEDRIPPHRAQGILSLSSYSLSTSLHQGPGGTSQGVTCCLYLQITKEESQAWIGPTSAFLQKPGLVWLHVHCTSVTILCVYRPVTSGSLSSVLVTSNSGTLPGYSCLLMKQTCIALLWGFPQLTVWF